MKSNAALTRRNQGLGWMTLAVASALLASTCCVLPLVLVLAGITGAWMVHLSVLKPATPYLVAAAVGALGWAGYLVFRPVQACSMEEDAACAVTRPLMRRLFVGCAVFIAALLLFPLIAPVFY
ncbi:mercuric transporter MerT family protein [Massilia horti]|uniref:mercuric transporter MerT family protein n=1 Tax=Massilia horti TaxID=2562153 RepID=UPI001431ABCC|nr:mercuric transporter MerT family protein [Massilia horti]